jgi:hypothetical protein
MVRAEGEPFRSLRWVEVEYVRVNLCATVQDDRSDAQLKAMLCVCAREEFDQGFVAGVFRLS